MDVNDSRPLNLPIQGVVTLLGKIVTTTNHRQIELEMALAEAQKITVRHIQLRGEDPVALWDFDHTEAHISQGYVITKESIAGWKPTGRSWLSRWMRREKDQA